MKEKLIEFGTAKLAKEKGFNLEVGLYYSITKQIKDHSHNLGWGYDSGCNFNDHKGYRGDKKKGLYPYFSAPTQSLLQKWLREEHEIEIQIFTMGIYKDKTTQPHSNWKPLKMGDGKNFKKYQFGLNAHGFYNGSGFDTYEEALEFALKEALKWVI